MSVNNLCSPNLSNEGSNDTVDSDVNNADNKSKNGDDSLRDNGVRM